MKEHKIGVLMADEILKKDITASADINLQAQDETAVVDSSHVKISVQVKSINQGRENVERSDLSSDYNEDSSEIDIKDLGKMYEILAPENSTVQNGKQNKQADRLDQNKKKAADQDQSNFASDTS